MFNQKVDQTTDAAEFQSFLNALNEFGVVPVDENATISQKYHDAQEAMSSLQLSGIYDPEKVVQAYGKAYSIPYIFLQTIDPSAYNLIDKELIQEYGLVPFDLDQASKTLQIAIYDPAKISSLNHEAVAALEQKLGLKIEIFISSQVAAQKALNNLNGSEVTEIDLSGMVVSPEVLQKMPIDLAKKFKAVIFKQSGTNIYDLATVDPGNPQLRELLSFVEEKGKIKLNIYKADEASIDQIIAGYDQGSGPVSVQPSEKAETEESKKVEEAFPSQTSAEGSSEADKKEQIEPMMENPDLVSFLGKNSVTSAELKAYAEQDQVPQFVAALIMDASAQRASDVHIEPFEKALRVRYRIDGELSDVIVLPASMTSSISARVKILSKLKIDEQRIPQDGRFDAKIGPSMIDIRVSTLPTVFGEKVVLRLLPKNKSLEKLEDVGLEGVSYDRLIEAISKPFGVVLATGPTGAGKTTTLYSILTRLNAPQVNIVTLEDPVEYELQGVNQVQVKPQIGFGFAEGLRSVLRQDPNIIMVGEIRDFETAELVTHAALTGHLVLSTLHTNDASGALPRLYNLGVEPFLLTSSINAILAQRLVRKVCPDCRVEIEVPQSVTFQVKKELEKLNLGIPLKFYKGKGCAKCKNGFTGRVGIFEVLTMSDAIENLLLQKKSGDDILRQAIADGMITMRQDGFIKAIKGITTIDEVLRVTSEVKEDSGVN